MRRALHRATALLLVLSFGAAARADPVRIELDPGATDIRFRLGATLHTVEGSAELVEGWIVFDPRGGAASGEIVVDARSARTGLEARDRQMHERVLESERHPVVVFRPTHLSIEEQAEEATGVRARVHLAGELELQGVTHSLTLEARVEAGERSVRIDASARIPYVSWGLADVSRFLLRVDDAVDVEIRAEGSLDRGAGQGAPL